MSKLLGFLSGVALVLGGGYWLLPPIEPPPLSAGSPPEVKANAAAPSVDRATPDWLPREPEQDESDQGLAGEGESVAFLPMPRPEPARSTLGGPEPSVGDDPGQRYTVTQQGVAETGAQPLGEVEKVESVMLSEAPAKITAAPSPGETLEVPASEQVLAPDDSLRFVFWSPFRSERAARGFADRLSLATAVRVDVVHLAPGRFRVAFDYRDEAERRTLLERIEQITGLQLSGDLPQ